MGKPSATTSQPPWGRTTHLAGLVLGFVALGLSHRSPSLALLAWLAMAAIAFGLHGPLRPGPLLGLLALGGIADIWIAHPWQLSSAWLYSGSSWWVTLLIVLGFTVANVVPKLLPVFATGWAVGRRLPVTVWFPVSWLLGEWLRDHTSRMSYNDWLNTQWQVTAVVKL